MLKRKIIAGIALATSVSLITPMGAPFAPVQSVVMAEEAELPGSETLPCENGENIQYTFEDGVLTISGKGDKLSEKSPFADNESITKVVFTDDCTLESMYYWFEDCSNLAVVENIPDTVNDMSAAFSHTALTKVPELPTSLKELDYTFWGCEGITEVDFAKMPSSIYDFGGAFMDTGVTNVTIAFPEQKNIEGDEINFAFAFSECSQLKTMVVDASNADPNVKLSLLGLCQFCSALESFELKNIPDNHKYPGAYSTSHMFLDCENLVSVKNEGYFFFSGEKMFKNCTSLKTIETKGICELFGKEDLDSAFMDCKALEGTYYLQLDETSQIYKGFYENKDLETVKEKLKNTFKGCNDKVTFYINCKPLVDYCNTLKTQEEYKFDATLVYWEEADKYERPGNPDTPEPTKTPAPVKKTKKITTLTLSKYKKGTKVITGKTISNAKVTVKVSNKNYTVKSNKKGAFTVKLKTKLKSKATIKVTVSKSGYTKKTKSFKVK